MLDVDLTAADLYATGFPHELFTDLRRQGAVLRHEPLMIGSGEPLAFWAVVAHAEIQQANRDWQTFSARAGQALAPLPERFRGNTLLSLDPPGHTTMRRLLTAGFTPRIVRRLEEGIRSRTERILDDVAARGTVDFVGEVAALLPMHVVADILGVPDDDRAEVFTLIDHVIRADDPALAISRDEARRAERELYAYAAALAAAKRAEPADDVWSVLAASELDPLEPIFFMLAGAGAETTQNALAMGLVALLEHPEQLAVLRADPDLVMNATEEVLRWTCPVLAFGREVTHDVELGGEQLGPGDRVVLFYPSGNRDEAVFADPFRFDIRRTDNPHLAFGGGGAHFCLGASLARTEIAVMLAALVRRFDIIELTGAPQWSAIGPVSNVGVGLASLPVRVTVA